MAVSFAEILAPGSKYQPPKCSPTVCYLTGPGGWVQEWEAWVDHHSDRRFVVRGTCASACEIAYRRALTLGLSVSREPGSRLIRHKRTTIWKFRRN